VNGIALTGSLVGAPFQGGNAWANWNGTLPYTDQGLIVGGGDHFPLPIGGAPFEAVAFIETGLPHGTRWTVSLGGTTYTTTGSVLVAYEPTGSYAYAIAHRAGLTPHPSAGTVVVGTHDISRQVVFS
jgi:hypothetical protein